MLLPMMIPSIKAWLTLFLGNCLHSQFPGFQEKQSILFVCFKEKSLNEHFSHGIAKTKTQSTNPAVSLLH